MEELDDLELISRNFEEITHRVPNLAAEFYRRFFGHHPELEELFANSHATQQQMLNESLLAVIDHLSDHGWVVSNMQSLGARHAAYDVDPEMYDWWASTLLDTLRELSGDDWSERLEAVWREKLELICSIARKAQLEAAKWVIEV